MNNGWIKLHKKFLESAIWKSNDSILIQLSNYCMFEANWQDKDVVIGNQVIKVKRGQFITGRKSLVKACTKLTDENSKEFKKMEFTYWRRLKLLEKLDFLHINSTTKYSLITVKNYNKYQDKPEENIESAQQMHNNSTTDAQQMHTTKEVKNIRNKEIKKERVYSSPSYLENLPEEDIMYFTSTWDLTKPQLVKKAQQLLDYCLAHGKTYKDYKAFLRNAISKDFKNRPLSEPTVEYEFDAEGLARVKKLKESFLVKDMASRHIMTDFEVNDRRNELLRQAEELKN